MIKVYFDDWRGAHRTSGFFLEVPYLPRLGEFVRLHSDVVSAEFMSDHEESFANGGRDFEGFGYFKVVNVEHTYNKDGTHTVVDLEEID